MNEQKISNWQEFQNGLIARAMKDNTFRQELISNPNAVVMKEMNLHVERAEWPNALEVKVIEQPANALYLVLPSIPDELSDEALEQVAAGSPGMMPSGIPTGCPNPVRNPKGFMAYVQQHFDYYQSNTLVQEWYGYIMSEQLNG